MISGKYQAFSANFVLDGVVRGAKLKDREESDEKKSQEKKSLNSRGLLGICQGRCVAGTQEVSKCLSA
jgi:hypothetical protein